MNFEAVKLLRVLLAFEGPPLRVGRLAYIDRRLNFEYAPNFLERKLELSPFKLPLKLGVIQSQDIVFDGLFGVFNDSLPDGWGRLLLDRQVQKRGIASQLLTPLDRLAHVGKFGMGALLYEPDYSTDQFRPDIIHLDQIASETRLVLEGDTNAVFEELLGLSGSSAGARPKVMVGVSKDKSRLIHGQQELPDTYEHWMVKFASSGDAKDAGAIEYAYSCMARNAGVEIMPTHLFPSKKGLGYFGVQRFDRRGNRRIHTHTISGLLHADHRLPSLDYELILRATLTLTKNATEVEKMFRIAVFNVFAYNRDDHAKNFSFLMDENGYWSVAPAYDLTFSSGPGGEHSTTVMGEGRSPTVANLSKLADKFGISSSRFESIEEKVQAAVSNWKSVASEAGVSKASIGSIGNVILKPLDKRP